MIWPDWNTGERVMATEDQWAFCAKCATLFFNGFDSKGRCAKGGPHDGNVSLPYFLFHSVNARPNQLNGFRFCFKCQSLYWQKDLDEFHGDGSTLGVCPAGGGHGAEPSLPYLLDRDLGQPHGEHKWFACIRCNCVTHGPEGERACAADTDNDGVIGHVPGNLDNDHPLLLVRFVND